MRTRYFLFIVTILASVLQIDTAETIKKQLRKMKMTRPVQVANIDSYNYKSPRKQEVQSQVLTEHDRMNVERHKVSTEKPSPGGVVGKMKYIIDGSASSRGQFPFLVGIDIDDDFFCGGSLISTTHILTAGHCADGSTIFDVYLGAKDRNSEEIGRVFMTTKKKTLHPKFNPNTLMNDLSILTLGQRVQLSQFIKIVRLPTQLGNINALVGSSVIVAGWGRTSDAVEEVSTTLFHAKLEMFPQSECAKVYGSGSVFFTNLCAGSPDSDQATCQGDSGGPMVIRDRDGAFTQIGVVSFGAATGCEMGYPDVFTRVASYLPWITSTAGIGAPSAAIQQPPKTKKKEHKGKQNRNFKKNRRAGALKMMKLNN